MCAHLCALLYNFTIVVHELSLHRCKTSAPTEVPLLRTQEVPSQEASYIGWGISWFSHSLQVTTRTLY